MKKLLIVFLLMISYSGFSQTIYKKGYIVNLQNESIEGFILIKRSIELYQEVYFTTDKKKTPEKYTPETIKSYGYGKNLRYDAVDIPTIKKSFLIDDKAINRRFLRVFSAADEITFYAYYSEGEKQFFLKNQDGILFPLVYNKTNVDNYKVKDQRYKLPTGELFNANESNLIKANDGKVYIYENNKLFEIKPIYQEELKKLAFSLDCIIDDKAKKTRLNQLSLGRYVDELEQYSGQSFTSVNRRFSPQISLLALGSTHPHSRNLHIGYEQGILLEVRENSISPNFSIGFGYFRNDVTNNIRRFEYESGGSDPLIARFESSSVLLKLNYHFRAGKNFRPFVAFNSRILSYQADYKYIGSDEILFTRNEANYPVGISTGIDYYLFRYVQLRAEVEFTNVLSYQIGFGISIN